MHVEEFVNIVTTLLAPQRPNYVQIATIPASYVSGNPRLIFERDGEESVKSYPTLDSYTPAAGDRVVCLRAGDRQDSWVVLGAIS